MHNVTVENQGDFPETFDVTVYGTNTTVVTVGTQQVILNPGENTTLQFDWDTSGIPPGLYTISASADVVPGETAPDQLDNTLTDGTIDVRFLGDAGAEYNIVDGSDVVIAIEAVPSVPGHLKWNPKADMNCDDVVDGSDIVIIIEHVPSSYP